MLGAGGLPGRCHEVLFRGISRRETAFHFYRILAVRLAVRGSFHVPRVNLAAPWGSIPGPYARRGSAALLLLATAISPLAAMAQQLPPPVFTELFAYDPAAPSQLLGKWLIIQSA